MHYLLELISDLILYWPTRNPPPEGRNAIPFLRSNTSRCFVCPRAIR